MADSIGKKSDYSEITTSTNMLDWALLINRVAFQNERNTIVLHGTMERDKTVYKIGNSGLNFNSNYGYPVFDKDNYEYIMLYGPLILKQASDNTFSDGDWIISGNDEITFSEAPAEEEVLDGSAIEFYILCICQKNHLLEMTAME